MIQVGLLHGDWGPDAARNLADAANVCPAPVAELRPGRQAAAARRPARILRRVEYRRRRGI